MYQASTNIRNFVALRSHCEAKFEGPLMFIQLSTAASLKQSLCSDVAKERFSNHWKTPVQFIGEVRLLRCLSSSNVMKTLLSLVPFQSAPRNDERSNRLSGNAYREVKENVLEGSL